MKIVCQRDYLPSVCLSLGKFYGFFYKKIPFFYISSCFSRFALLLLFSEYSQFLPQWISIEQQGKQSRFSFKLNLELFLSRKISIKLDTMLLNHSWNCRWTFFINYYNFHYKKNTIFYVNRCSCSCTWFSLFFQSNFSLFFIIQNAFKHS